MKLRKQLATFFAVSVMGVVAASSSFAAGVGYVNFGTLVQSHKDYPKVTAQMQSAIKDANEKFSKQAPNLKSDQERQKLGRDLTENLGKLEKSLMTPIDKDITSKTEQVRKEKGLDYIVAEGSIIAGANDAVDETEAVKALLK